MKKQTFDVIVVGGGSAGLAAAVSAKKNCEKVCLLEKYGFLGGQAVSANVGTICGLYKGATFDLSLAGAFAQNFISRLNSITGDKPQKYKDQLAFLPYQSWAFEQVSLDLIRENKIDLILHAVCCGTQVKESRLVSLQVLINNEIYEFQAKAFIDASGEGLLSNLSNQSLIKEDFYQAPAFVFQLSNLKNLKEENLETLEHKLNLEILSALVHFNANSEVESKALRITIVPGSLRLDSCKLKLAYPFERTDKLQSQTEIEIFGRTASLKAFYFLKMNLDSFKEAKLDFLSAQAGFRSGMRGEGRYILTNDDIISPKKFSDFIAYGLWPIEFWDASRKVKFEILKNPYQIPASVLTSKGLANLFFAGRGISADKKALSSARVIGTAFQTGFAAGKLAAKEVENKPINEIIKEIQKEF